MTQRIFEPKILTLVANVAQSAVWGTAEFGKYYSQYDAVIRGNVSVRFQVQNLTANVIYLSLNYETIYENIPFQERKSLAGVAANTTVELSKATVPAIGLLKTDIKSITITVIGASAGTVRITLLIGDQDQIAAEGSSSGIIGQDDTVTQAYTPVSQNGQGLIAAATSVDLVDYTVTAGKRFYLDLIEIHCDITPSYPGDMIMYVILTISGVVTSIQKESYTDKFLDLKVIENFATIMAGGDNIKIRAQNISAIGRNASGQMTGREVF